MPIGLGGRRRRSSSNSSGIVLIGVAVLTAVWPWWLGTFLAVRLGADHMSTTRTLVGWLFEIPWLIFLAIAIVVVMRRHRERQKALAAYNAVRPVPGSGGTTVYHHGGCTVNHRTAESAASCRKG